MPSRGSLPREMRPERSTLQGGLRPSGDGGRRLGWRQSHLLAGALTVSVHLTVLAALLWPHTRAPAARAEPAPLQVSLVELPKPKPSGPPNPIQTDADLSESFLRPTAPHFAAPVLTDIETPVPDTSDLLSQAQLAGAVRAGAGGGGVCDMALVLQRALRRDPLVRTAVVEAHRWGKAIMLWDGDWVRSGDQEGKGLSAVREAIMWEVAFAPKACRNQRVHGLVLLSLADGGTRFAIGSGDWRWSDLLGLRGVASRR